MKMKLTNEDIRKLSKGLWIMRYGLNPSKALVVIIPTLKLLGGLPDLAWVWVICVPVSILLFWFLVLAWYHKDTITEIADRED